MDIIVLKELLLARGEIDKYYEGCVPINLWRGLNVKKRLSLFELIEEPFRLANGRPRPADIKIRSVNGVKWVSVENRPRGISTFDQPGVPPGKDWEYYRIPAGTVLPKGLAIVKDEFNSVFGATHYTIAPAYDMPLEHFKQLLSKLAADVIREAM
jgi:hypothetical protein